MVVVEVPMIVVSAHLYLDLGLTVSTYDILVFKFDLEYPMLYLHSVFICEFVCV